LVIVGNTQMSELYYSTGETKFVLYSFGPKTMNDIIHLKFSCICVYLEV